jgi:pectate lyase
MHNIKNKYKWILIKINFLLICTLNIVHGQGNIPAFPGAEGYGTETVGGRGGQVIEVTNLNDNGPGSLREAIETAGPRIVVFRVGGTIELQSRFIITHPYITIAGQTAPGEGITIKGNGENSVDGTHDVIIRYIRFRGTRVGNMDCLNIVYGSYNVVIDHCSFSWGMDETISVSAKSHDVTIQWCIIAEGLQTPTSKGSLVSSGSYNVSIHHSLYAHNGERNAKMKGYPVELEGNPAYYDYVNNVVYNWEGYAHSVAGSGKGNVIGNYFKPGPNTNTYPQRREIVRQQHEEGRQIYARDNIGPTCPQGCESDWDAGMFLWKGVEYNGGMISDISGDYDSNGYGTRTDTPIPAPPVETLSATVAYDRVLENSGVVFPFRDAVDERVVNDVINGSGNIIMDPSEVGGWPILNSGIPPTDTDHDGIPDDWEITNGLDINDPSDGLLDADEDGYTNVEEYINELISDDTVPPNPPGSINLEEITETTITFSWSAPGPASDGDLAESYRIIRDNVLVGSTTETHFTDAGLTKNTTYNYKVYSLDDASNRNNTPSVAVFTTTGDLTPPRVTSVRGLNLNILEIVFNETVEQQSAENITNYDINNGISITHAYLQNDTFTVLLHTSDQIHEQSYNLTINNIIDRAPAQNKIATNTKISFTADDPVPPNPAENLSLESRTETSVSFTWTAPGPASDGDIAASYRIKRDNVTIGTTTETGFTDTGLTINTTYYYKVYSYDANGNRATSGADAYFTTTEDLTPPIIASARGLSLNTIEVVFSEAVESEGAGNVNNYLVNNGISITDAYLQNDTKTVHLRTTTQVEGQSYDLTINNISDRAPAQNKISANTTISYNAVDNLLIIISADNEYEFYINGNKLGGGNNWWDAESYVFPVDFEKIVIAAKGIDLGGEAGFVACIEIDGKILVSDETWKVTNTLQPFWVTNEFVDDSWSTATAYGELGSPNAMPWAGTPNGGTVHGLSNDRGAKWIWTNDNVNDDVAYFRYVIYLRDITPPNSPQGVTVKIP